MNRAFVVTLCAFLGAACTPATDPGSEVPGCEGKCDGIGEFAPIAGPESLVHCELTSTRDVVCDYTGVPASFPIDVTIDITALGQGFTDSSGQLHSGQLASIEFQEPGSFTLLGALPTDQLPVTLLVSLEMRADFLVGDQVADRSNLRSVTQTFVFDSAGDETSDLPLPLEFWPVRLFAADGGNVRSLSVGPQTIDVAPWEFFIGPSEVGHQFTLPTIQSEPQEFLLPVAPGSTTLNASGTHCASDFSCDGTDFVFNGPGIYALSRDGAVVFEPPTGVDAGPGLDSGPSLDGGRGLDGSVSVDAGSDAGAPPCGTNGQRPCEDGTCAPNHELDGDFCFPCGIDGEARCSGESDCANGHRLVSNVCQACGADAQIACREGNDDVCNEGHRRMSDNTCAACGADGQIACRDGNDNVCNEGHRRMSDNTCAACGSDGQIACRDGNDNVCNEGHRRLGDGTCAVCGADGQITCRVGNDNVCDEGHRRLGDGTCAVCGGNGEVPCREGNDNVCDDGFRVSSFMCVPE